MLHLIPQISNLFSKSQRGKKKKSTENKIKTYMFRKTSKLRHKLLRDTQPLGEDIEFSVVTI